MKLICDFCGDPTPIFIYTLDRRGDTLTAAFKDESGTWQDTDEWLACGECARLLDAGKAANGKSLGEFVAAVTAIVKRNHNNPALVNAVQRGELTWAIADAKIQVMLLTAILPYDWEKKSWGPQ